MQLVYIGSPENAFVEAGLTLDLRGDDRIVFGRSSGRRIAVERRSGVLWIEIPLPWVSGRHCELLRSGANGRASIIDLDSRNGTRVCGKTIEETGTLHVGDVLEVGRSFWILRDAVIEDEAHAPHPSDLEGLPHPLLPERVEVLARAARSRVPVLVTGPSGGGKRRLAKWLHARSGRPGPLVVLDLGKDAEEELHARVLTHSDALPLALRDADRGTLCLRGIDTLALPMQEHVRTLVVETALARGTDVRLIATSTRDLRDAVADGSFRRELYARLSGCEVRVPALRERLDRLGVLIRAFYDGPHGPELHVTTEAFRYALSYPWPDNMRQLRQALTNAMTIASREGWIGQPVLAEALEQRRSFDAFDSLSG